MQASVFGDMVLSSLPANSVFRPASFFGNTPHMPLLVLPGAPSLPPEPGEIPSRIRGAHLIRPIDILVVEDSPDFRRSVAAALMSEGYEVLSAADGVDALRVLEYTDPWLLLLDMQLPRMDGKALIQEIRQRRFNVKIVIMTGTQDARRLAQELRADAYLAKPFDLDELSRIAERYGRRSAG